MAEFPHMSRSRMVKASFSSKAESFSRPFSRLFSASIRPQLSFFYPFSRRWTVDEKDAKRIFGKSIGCPILALNWPSTIKKKRIEREESSCNAKFSCKNTEMMQVTQNNGRMRLVPKACPRRGGIDV